MSPRIIIYLLAFLVQASFIVFHIEGIMGGDCRPIRVVALSVPVSLALFFVLVIKKIAEEEKT